MFHEFSNSSDKKIISMQWLKYNSAWLPLSSCLINFFSDSYIIVLNSQIHLSISTLHFNKILTFCALICVYFKSNYHASLLTLDHYLFHNFYISRWHLYFYLEVYLLLLHAIWHSTSWFLIFSFYSLLYLCTNHSHLKMLLQIIPRFFILVL